MVKILQPPGVRYLIQEGHYSQRDAQEYIDLLISQSERYISLKLMGKRVAPLMTIEQLEAQLENIKKFVIIEVQKS